MIIVRNGAATVTETRPNAKRSTPAPARDGVNVVRLLLEGRAFFALIAIIVVFVNRSPVLIGRPLRMDAYISSCSFW